MKSELVLYLQGRLRHVHAIHDRDKRRAGKRVRRNFASMRADSVARTGAGDQPPLRPLLARGAVSASPAIASAKSSLRRGSIERSREVPSRRRHARIGITALAMLRWPPALPMSANSLRTTSPALPGPV